jgi:hypothetical protein
VHTPATQFANVSHVADVSSSLQGCPSARMFGHVAPAPLPLELPDPLPPPLEPPDDVKGQLPVWHLVVPPQGWPAATHVIAPHVEVRGSQPRPVAHWRSVVQAAPACPGLLHDLTPTSPGHTSPAAQSLSIPHALPALAGAAHVCFKLLHVSPGLHCVPG